MLPLIGFLCCLIAAWLVWVMIRDHLRGEVEIFSIRNIAIIGFIIFQMTSASLTLFTDTWTFREPTNKNLAAVTFLFYAIIFLPIAFWVYRRGFVANWLARKIPQPTANPGDMGLLLMAVVFTILGAILHFGVQIPLVGVVANYVATGVAAVACGFTGWVWGKRLFNPAAAMYAISIVGVNTIIVLTGAFGRRGLVAVGFGLLWGMYYSHFRKMPLSRLGPRLLAIGIVPVLATALYSSVRESGTRRSGLGHLTAILQGGQILDGLQKIFSGQGAGSISMWLIDTHPSYFETRHLFTIRFYIMYPIPRDLWPEKPYPLALRYAEMAQVDKMGEGWNVGPGLLGTAGAEGGLYALVIYAAASGIFLKFFDETTRLNRAAPMIVLPMGSAIGNTLALARGEVSAFAATITLQVAGTLIMTFTISWLLENMGFFRADIDDDVFGPGADDDPDYSEFGDFSDYDVIASDTDRSALPPAN